MKDCFCNDKDGFWRHDVEQDIPVRGMSKSVTFQIKFPLKGFQHVFYFNQFRLARNGSLCIFQVLLDQPLSQLTFAIEMESLKKFADGLLRVVERVGQPAHPTTEPWKGFADGLAPYSAPELVDFVYVSLGEYQEMVLGRVSAAGLSRLQAEDPNKDHVVEPEPVAMLRTDRQTMVRFLGELGTITRSK